MPIIGSSLAPYLPLVEGKEVGGEIVDFRIQQTTNYDNNRPEYLEVNAETGVVSPSFSAYRSDGAANAPAVQWVFTVETGEEDESGDTERRIFLDARTGKKGTDVEGKRSKDAINIAVKRAKAHRVGLEIGGSIWVTRGPQIAPKRGDAKCNTFTARYEPPAGGPGTGTPVSDVIHMIGGGVFDPAEREAELPPVPAFNVRPAGAAEGASNVLVGAGAAGVAKGDGDDDPPF